MEQTILTPQQQKFLSLLTYNKEISNQFYFTGGTALTEYYIHHRESEDLDFFCEQEFDIEPLRIFMSQTKSYLNFNEFDYQQSRKYAKNRLSTSDEGNK